MTCLLKTKYHFAAILIFIFALPFLSVKSQSNELSAEKIKNVMLKATGFVTNKLGGNGGYVWYYLPDLSRRWGEMEAYSSMAWVQGSGTVGMGNTFLNAYEVTKDEFYFRQAESAAHSLIKGQLECGGWNYMIDYNGEESLKKWYDTIGKNGWRLEEFRHYYGNATFDDEVSEGAADFLLRLFLLKKDKYIKTALDKAINFILESQYENGAWPQRFPAKEKFSKNGNPDYTPYYTFNDNVIWNNLKFLIKCYEALGDGNILGRIKNAMNFFIISQQSKPQAGWAMQYSMDLKPAGARTYEPNSLDPQFTARHVEILIKFFKMTGDNKYLSGIPAALEWIESVKIKSLDEGKTFTVPKFVEIGSNKFLYLHRKGSNVHCGKYFFDYDSGNLVSHYGSIRVINLKELFSEYEKTRNIEIIKTDSDEFSIPGLKPDLPAIQKYKIINEFLELPSEKTEMQKEENTDVVENIINDLDSEGRWLVQHVLISNPYNGEPDNCDSTTTEYSTAGVGDMFDTSPFPDKSGQKYISTGAYIKNMNLLMKYLEVLNTK